MPHTSNEIYDFVIVGSGLGGLTCAYVLASEGYKVAVLEKNHQIGGHLQVYSRDKAIFDTGVHYIGSMNEGQSLRQFFKYFGIYEDLKLYRMDEACFDKIRFSDGSTFDYPQGYPAFIAKMIEYFPDESEAINKYCDKIKSVCEQFPLYNLKSEEIDYHIDNELLTTNAYQFIASLTENQKLRNVLAGSNMLYAGYKETTPFYEHALIMNSYLNGTYKLQDGGSQIAILMSRKIRKLGGTIRKHSKVVSAVYHENGHVDGVVLETGEVVRGKEFISNVHPAQTIDLFGADRFLKVYNNRIKNLDNSISTLLVHFAFKEKSFPYLNYNIYQYDIDDVWGGINYDQKKWPQTYFICTPVSSKNSEFATSMSVMTYMNASETEQWKDSTKTVLETNEREASYYRFKKDKEAKVIAKIEKIFPDISSQIQSVHSASPLTFRDYIGGYEGSLYGIRKNSNAPSQAQINTKTRIANLHLTGQNISLHGILGVTVSALVTCFAFLDKKKLIDKIKQAK